MTRGRKAGHSAKMPTMLAGAKRVSDAEHSQAFRARGPIASVANIHSAFRCHAAVEPLGFDLDQGAVDGES